MYTCPHSLVKICDEQEHNSIMHLHNLYDYYSSIIKYSNGFELVCGMWNEKPLVCFVNEIIFFYKLRNINVIYIQYIFLNHSVIKHLEQQHKFSSQ